MQSDVKGGDLGLREKWHRWQPHWAILRVSVVTTAAGDPAKAEHGDDTHSQQRSTLRLWHRRHGQVVAQHGERSLCPIRLRARDGVELRDCKDPVREARRGREALCQGRGRHERCDGIRRVQRDAVREQDAVKLLAVVCNEIDVAVPGVGGAGGVRGAAERISPAERRQRERQRGRHLLPPPATSPPPRINQPCHQRRDLHWPSPHLLPEVCQRRRRLLPVVCHHVQQLS